MNDCEHDKVMSNISYPSNPPQTPWICSKCGEKGMHVPQQENKSTYDELIKKFKK